MDLTYMGTAYNNHVFVRTIKPPTVNDVILSYRQYMYSEVDYDGEYNKINATTVPVVDDDKKTIGIPFNGIDENHYFLLFDSSGKQISNSKYYLDIDHGRIVKYDGAFTSPYVSIFNTTNTRMCTTIEYSVVCTDTSSIAIPSNLFDKTVSTVSLFNEDGVHISNSTYTITSDGALISTNSSFVKGTTYRILLEQYNTLSFDTIKDIRYITAESDNQTVYTLPFTYNSFTDMIIVYSPDGLVITPYEYTLDETDNTITINSSLSISAGDKFDVHITRFLETPATINEIDSIKEAL